MFKGVKRGVEEYLRETTIHGFRYVIEGRNLIEKMAWMFFIFCGFFLCSVSFLEMYRHWEEHPVETTIDEVGIPIQELPFPAITVCDTKEMTMPRKNRWMFLETYLNTFKLRNLTEQVEQMYPGKVFNH